MQVGLIQGYGHLTPSMLCFRLSPVARFEAADAYGSLEAAGAVAAAGAGAAAGSAAAEAAAAGAAAAVVGAAVGAGDALHNANATVYRHMPCIQCKECILAGTAGVWTAKTELTLWQQRTGSWSQLQRSKPGHRHRQEAVREYAEQERHGACMPPDENYRGRSSSSYFRLFWLCCFWCSFWLRHKPGRQ